MHLCEPLEPLLRAGELVGALGQLGDLSVFEIDQLVVLGHDDLGIGHLQLRLIS